MPANTQEGLGHGDVLIHNTIYHLLNFEMYTSFPDALRGAAIANDFQMILLSTDLHPVFSVETRHRTTVGAAVKMAKDELPEETAVYSRIDVNGIITYWGMVRIGEQPYRMFLVDNEDLYTAEEMTRLGRLIELAMKMWHFTPGQDAKGEFVRALKRGNTALAYSLRNEAEIDPSGIIGVFILQGSFEEGESLCKSLEAGGFQVHRIRGEETCGLLMTGTRTQEDAVQAIEIYRTFSEAAGGEPAAGKASGGKAAQTGSPGMRIFHVTGISGPESAGSAFALIQQSEKAAVSVKPRKTLFDRYDLTFAKSAAAIYGGGDGQRQEYDAWFDPFRGMTAVKRRQFLETLETFLLDAGQNTQQTAAILGIHMNTVQYRLHRAEEKMGTDILQGPVTPALVMALALRRLAKADKSGHPR